MSLISLAESWGVPQLPSFVYESMKLILWMWYTLKNFKNNVWKSSVDTVFSWFMMTCCMFLIIPKLQPAGIWFFGTGKYPQGLRSKSTVIPQEYSFWPKTHGVYRN